MPTFSWSSVPGAATYELFVADNLSPKVAVIGSSTQGVTGITGTTFTPSTSQALTPGHSYTWYIAAISANNAVQAWSGPQTFSLNAMTPPTQVGPVGSTTIAVSNGYDMPTFSWNLVSGAATYELFVADNLSPKVSVIGSSTQGVTGITGATFTPSTSQALTPGHTYTWYIGAVSTNGNGVGWSGPQSFSLAALPQPAQNGPSGTVVGTSTTVSFSWTATPGAAHYYVYVLNGTTNKATFNASASGTSTTLTLTVGYSYTWYLGAISTNGVAISWSGPKTFSLASTTPALAAPAQVRAQRDDRGQHGL